jgi:hypothetical protein
MKFFITSTMKRYEKPEWSSTPKIKYTLEVLKNGIIVGVIDFPVNEEFVILGRSEELCSTNFIFEHSSISRQHAVIQHRNNGRLYIYDLGSTHHTYWNKEEIKPFQYIPLRTGDLLKFGESTRQYIVASDDVQAHVLSEEQRKLQNRTLEDLIKKKFSKKEVEEKMEDEEEEEEDEEEKNAFDEEDEEELRQKKRLRIEEEINPNSMFDEDDEFFDRTLKNKKKKVQQRVETAQTLSKQREKIHVQILELEKRKKEVNEKGTKKGVTKEEEEEDPLDAYIKEMEKKIVDDDTTTIDEQLADLFEKRNELDKLIELSRPAIEGLKTKEQRKEEEKMDVITQNMFVAKKKNKFVSSGGPKKVEVHEVVQTKIVPKKQEKEFKKPVQKIQPAGVTPVGLVMNEELQSNVLNKPDPDDDFAPSTLDEDFEPSTLENEEDDFAPSTLKEDFEPEPNQEDEEEVEEVIQEKPKMKSAPNWYENVDETKSTWTAPRDQTGDGKTKLNEKYGY